MTVGRLAPSPTGLLHLGHARSFLLAWWQVRAAGGRIVMRIEDLDPARSRAEFADAALRDLEWLGLDWDGPVVYQSDRREAHADALETLERDGRAYPCICTRAEVLADAVRAPHADERERVYPGTCRGRFPDRSAATQQSGRSAGLRVRVPAGRTEFDDGLRGPQSQDVARDVGDFPVMRRDGVPSYQLAVIVDDAIDGVDTVLRGDDLLPSTARQKLLQVALELPHPRWFHVSLVTDDEGLRFAKRNDSLSLVTLREAGVDPRSIVGWAARSAGQVVPERTSANDVVASFALENVPADPVRFSAAERASLTQS